MRRNQKLYRQAKAERIQHHQASSPTNAKGSSLDRKHRNGVTRTQNNKVNDNEIILINNYLKRKWVECLNQRQRLAEWIQKQDPYICCLQETHLETRDTYRLKVKGWKKIFHSKRDQKTAVVAIPL